MEKVLIDTKEKFIEFLIACGISKQIIEHAKKMDLNVTKLFYDKLVNDYAPKKLDEVTKNLLGVYGNCIATLYYKNIFKGVENEVPINDINGTELTKADIVFTDNDGIENYCEVKAVSQIIDNIRNYVDEDVKENGMFEDKDNEIIKFKNIGKKLITQVKKLSKVNGRVNVVVFKGCIIDDIIKRKLSELNAKIFVIATDITELEDWVREKVINIKKRIDNNVVIAFEMDENKKLKKR